ncbi:amino acid-binding protein [Candidatus Micrarchaeota archaeon]|nr:amino acid-binding protein [Candidatus Micrarchaeota archaeon]
MWNRVSGLFGGLPAQKSVARKLVELGLRIREDGKICCGDVEVKDASLAQSAGVDRRMVRRTIAGIRSDPYLNKIFSHIQPAGSLLREVAPMLGFGVVEIEADARRGGIVAAATQLLAEKRIRIRQVYAKDPELFENPTLLIITERKIPGALLNRFPQIKGVKKVSIY